MELNFEVTGGHLFTPKIYKNGKPIAYAKLIVESQSKTKKIFNKIANYSFFKGNKYYKLFTLDNKILGKVTYGNPYKKEPNILKFKEEKIIILPFNPLKLWGLKTHFFYKNKKYDIRLKGLIFSYLEIFNKNKKVGMIKEGLTNTTIKLDRQLETIGPLLAIYALQYRSPW